MCCRNSYIKETECITSIKLKWFKSSFYFFFYLVHQWVQEGKYV